ncbi:isoprenyl transferase [Alteribacter natronophilus]|uniref:isoprenyl transferase n=1 Tax=Alteribacter natronophilus TaxID=2583810 RepID=UPI00110E5B88|nr:isoprenyl transferase [Alteribacter natronophilus]TMW73238.1 isoprenyl transferase [Alteribacter natronophilus]
MLKKWTNRKTETDYPLSEEQKELDPHNIPNHVAIIMDGNGRWAKKRGLPRVAGHREGMNVIKKIVKRSSRLGVGVLTLYAFSTENWKRPKPEVDFLMRLPERFLKSELPKLIEENVQVRITGSREALPGHTREAVEQAVEDTRNNDGMVLNFALNYGSRNEMVQAIRQIYSRVESGEITIDDVSEETVASALMTEGLDDPDLLIRTSGEIRLSNFMLWQLAYAEFWFTDVLWPDFTEHHFEEALAVYQKRTRRYGGV